MNRLIQNCLLSLTIVAANCFAGNAVVTGNAAGDLVIGHAPPAVNRDRLVFRRWESDENGERYELLRVKVEGIEVDAEVYDGSIWRIWIEKAGLTTCDGVGVGDSVQKLLRKNRTVNPEIGPGPSMVLIPKNPCGISYVTDAQLADFFPGSLTQAFVSKVAKAAHIKKILVVGCNK